MIFTKLYNNKSVINTINENIFTHFVPVSYCHVLLAFTRVHRYWDTLLCLFSYSTVVCLYRIADASQKENLGIVVHYKVKVRLILGFGHRSVTSHVSKAVDKHII